MVQGKLVSDEKKIVTYLINDLGKGGAEMMLYQLLKYRTDLSIEYRVISLGGEDYYKKLIQDLSISVTTLDIKKHPVSSLFRLRRLLYGIDAISCWMYNSNLIGYIVGKTIKVNRVIWNVRHSDLKPEHNKRSTLLINWLCAKLSGKVSFIAYNGEKAREVHEEAGYCRCKGIVVENGVDIDDYAYHLEGRKIIESELTIAQGKKIVLSVSRYAPIKDVATFIKTVSILHKAMPEIVAVICGKGITDTNESIVADCESNGLVVGKDIHLLGLRHDVRTLMSACDIFILHSTGEAFPNTLVQAMSCGCLCISTDVGDARTILGNSSFISEPANPVSLSKVALNALSLNEEETNKVRVENRKRVCDYYDIKSIVQQYEDIIKRV